MLPPWLAFLALTAMAIALAYQIASHRYGWRLIWYWLLILVSLTGCEALAESMGWNVTRLGDLRLAPDLSGGALAVLVLWFLGV